MFIETLEFTLPVDFLTSTLKCSPQSDIEFPASVNSYGTTQDANILVVMRANKLTFKVDGVSSNASIVSKSECKTLKLSVFDVDQSNLPPENPVPRLDAVSVLPFHTPGKRGHDSMPEMSPILKQRKLNKHGHKFLFHQQQEQQKTRLPENKTSNDSIQEDDFVLQRLKNEPEDVIEIEPDTEIDYQDNSVAESSDRMSCDPTAVRSAFHQTEYDDCSGEPSTSCARSEQGSERDEHNFQQISCKQEYDNEENTDYSNDDVQDGSRSLRVSVESRNSNDVLADVCSVPQEPFLLRQQAQNSSTVAGANNWPCSLCGKVFRNKNGRTEHIQAVHEQRKFSCVCGKVYCYSQALSRHRRFCKLVDNRT